MSEVSPLYIFFIVCCSDALMDITEVDQAHIWASVSHVTATTMQTDVTLSLDNVL